MQTTSPVPARVRRASVALVGLAAAAITPVALAAPDPTGPAATSSSSPRALDLGPADLTETRRTTTLQPGVTLTRIDRGGSDPSLFWTNEISIPATDTSPDPDAPPRSISDRASAQAEADRLESDGFTARVEEVRQPETADVPAGVLGYRVRVGSYPTQAEADAGKARLAQAGETASSVYTGWDGDASDRGPWHVDVLRIDPKTFDGRLAGSFGPDLFHRETTSQLAAAGGATAAVNGGVLRDRPRVRRARRPGRRGRVRRPRALRVHRRSPGAGAPRRRPRQRGAPADLGRRGAGSPTRRWPSTASTGCRG